MKDFLTDSAAIVAFYCSYSVFTLRRLIKVAGYRSVGAVAALGRWGRIPPLLSLVTLLLYMALVMAGTRASRHLIDDAIIGKDGKERAVRDKGTSMCLFTCCA